MMSIDDFLFAPLGASNTVVMPSTQPIDLPIPESWLQVVNSIQCHPSWMCSAIAGGALRDLDNGRSVKDVDIFVPYLGSNEMAMEKLKNLGLGVPIMELEHSAHNTSQLGSEGISHFHFEVDGWKFEVSQKTEQFDYQTLLDSFDIGICMISLDPSNAVFRTPEYRLDKTMKQLRVIRKTGGREIEHAERLARKYKDWKIVPI